MKKKKAITLLSMLSVLLAFLIVMTFARFPIGINNYKSVIGAIDLDYDLAGGVAYTLTLAGDNEEEVKDVDQVVETLENRIKALGYQTFSVKAIKDTDEDVLDYDIRIELKETTTVDTDISVIASYGSVKFYGGTSSNPTEEILADVTAVKGSSYLGSFSGYDNEGNPVTQYGISIEFTEECYNELIKEIEKAEANNESYYLSIKLVGDEETELWPGTSAIKSDDISNRVLNGYLTDESTAKQLALQIGSGGLNYKYNISAGQYVTSPYGENIPTKVAISIGAILALVMIVMLFAYKGFGIISALSMLCFMQVEVIMMIAVPGVVLSLGGVVGIIVATLFTAIAITNVASRIKEECKDTQKTVKAAVKKSFASSLMSTIIAGAVAGVMALALFFLTSGLVKGFAITFGIGVGVGLISALVFTRMFTALIFPLVKNCEAFLGLKREDK